jgi:hypothetical protein
MFLLPDIYVIIVRGNSVYDVTDRYVGDNVGAVDNSVTRRHELVYRRF